MPRIVKEEAYLARRNEILDVAQRLIYTTGYEQMSIQDILGELHISKGAFYHYFASKQAMLEALIERMQVDAEALIHPIFQDETLSAIEKLQRFFTTSARWKTEHKGFVLALMRAWYKDENAIVRQKVVAFGMQRTIPLLAGVIQQGIGEGGFTTAYADVVGEVVMCLTMGLGDALSTLLLNYEPERSDVCIERTVAGYSDALERVLGAPAGSLLLVDAKAMQVWVDALYKTS
jgi:AcrR family transcriptional regulator